jgi:hypothetical protein
MAPAAGESGATDRKAFIRSCHQHLVFHAYLSTQCTRQSAKSTPIGPGLILAKCVATAEGESMQFLWNRKEAVGEVADRHIPIRPGGASSANR